MSNTTTAGPIKEIKYDRRTKDFAYLLNGEIVSWAPTHLQAEQALNEVVYTLLARDTVTAADLSPEDAADVLAGQQLAPGATLATME